MKKFWNWIKDSDDTRTSGWKAPSMRNPSGAMRSRRRCSGMSWNPVREM